VITAAQARLRMTSPGRLFTMAPSTWTSPSTGTGTNTPDSDALARNAVAREPHSNAAASLRVGSHDTQ
jgi:hypothetical protein